MSEELKAIADEMWQTIKSDLSPSRKWEGAVAAWARRIEAATHVESAVPEGFILVPRDPIAATIPVDSVKAFGAHTLAAPWLDKGAGPKAMVGLINMGLTGWTHTAETAKAYADGYNRAVKLFQAWLLHWESRQPAAPSPPIAVGQEKKS